jgi:hypothetical protein
MGSREIDSGRESINRWVDKKVDCGGESTIFVFISSAKSECTSSKKQKAIFWQVNRLLQSIIDDS